MLDSSSHFGEHQLQKTSVTLTPFTVTISYSGRFFGPKEDLVVLKIISYRLAVTVGYIDIFSKPHNCHCNRSYLYQQVYPKRMGPARV